MFLADYFAQQLSFAKHEIYDRYTWCKYETLKKNVVPNKLF